eukprot:m.355994 g.355994  ORF g.355994 m.355994 type:complete len:87 (-) comp17411_c0_seq1:110-370(-)
MEDLPTAPFPTMRTLTPCSISSAMSMMSQVNGSTQAQFIQASHSMLPKHHNKFKHKHEKKAQHMTILFIDYCNTSALPTSPTPTVS